MVARVQRPAPAFKATAVVEGMFKDISLADYLGQWWVLFSCSFEVVVSASASIFLQGRSFLLPNVGFQTILERPLE